MSSPDLTISIVSYNTSALLRDCLNSVYENIRDIKLEVIVVDNNSTDKSAEMLKKGFPQITLIQNKENVGFAKANNQALRKSKGRSFLLLNSDTVLSPNSLNTMVNFIDSHPKVGVVGCRLFYPDGSVQPWPCISSNVWSSLWLALFGLLNVKRLLPGPRFRSFLGRYFRRIMDKGMASYLGHYWDNRSVQEVDQVSGACLLARRSAIEQTGLLDENFFMYGEDIDWCIRMKQEGWKVYLLSDVKVIHYASQSFKETSNPPLLQKYKSMYYFFEKHYGRKAAISLKILVISSMLIKEGFFLVTYLLSSKREESKMRLKSGFDLIKFSISRITKEELPKNIIIKVLEPDIMKATRER